MSTRLVAAAFAVCLFLFTASARASCGTSSCPIDLNALNRPSRGSFTAELSFEHIDQNNPRIANRSARIGELHADHDEVRTTNRSVSLLVRYGLTDRVQLSAALPFVSRTHDHLASSHAAARGRAVAQHNNVPQRWDINETGDVLVEARARVWGSNVEGLWLTAGAKLPTGADDVANAAGNVAEASLQPGTGSTDGIVGLAYEMGFIRGDEGHATMIPLFLSATFRANGTGSGGYRAGNELQLNAGTAWPIAPRIELLAQANARHRNHDVLGGDEHHLAGADAFTGGTAIYASPGVRVSFGQTAVYALVQVPIYQDVNGLQLTARQNYVAGVQWRR